MEDIADVTGTSRWRLEVDNEKHPESIFMIGSNGTVVEFDRQEAIAYVKEAYGLIDPLEMMWEAPAAARDLPKACAGCVFATLRC